MFEKYAKIRFLFGITPFNALTYAGVMVVLMVTAAHIADAGQTWTAPITINPSVAADIHHVMPSLALD